MPAPVAGTYPAYFKNYISLVDANSAAEAIEKYSTFLIDYFKNIPFDKASHSYAAGKWSIKEMLQHIIDAERIFAYRALRIARQDKTPLAGFDENAYAAASHAANRSWTEMLAEFEVVRKSTDLLIKSFADEDLQQQGITNEHSNSCIAVCFVVYGHILHHINILKERYL